MGPFVWIFVYIGIMAAAALVVRWILICRERRRASKEERPPGERAENGK